MRHEYMIMFLRIGDEQVVRGVARERGDGPRSEVARSRRCRQRREVLCRALIDRTEKVQVLPGPSGKLIVTRKQLVSYRLDTAGDRLLMRPLEPRPESGSNIEGSSDSLLR